MKMLVRFMFTIMLIGLLAACGSNTTDDNGSEQNETIDTEEPATEEGSSQTTEEGSIDEDDDDADEEDATTSGAENDSAVIKEKMEELGFSEIEIDVDYVDGSDFEVDIDKDGQGNYQAKLEDEINNKKLKGIEAFDALYPALQKLEITKDSSQDEVINQVISAFELNGDYKEIDVEIIFSDGTKIEFEDRQ